MFTQLFWKGNLMCPSSDVYNWIWLCVVPEFHSKTFLWPCRPELDSAHCRELLPASLHSHCPAVQSQPAKYVASNYRDIKGPYTHPRICLTKTWTCMWRVTKSKLSSLPPSSPSSLSLELSSISPSLELSSITTQQSIVQRILRSDSNPSHCQICFSASISTFQTPSLESWLATAIKAGAPLGQYQPGQLGRSLTASPSKIGFTLVTLCFYTLLSC